MKKPKVIFVVGGVMSSIGKGVAAASMGKVLQSRGYKVANIKCDMYVNIDAGTIRPAEHGEVFVGEDGIEADQDLGNYERFTNQLCTRDNYVTTGQIYAEVIRRERNLEYKGEDVEVVPDIPNEIIRRIHVCQQQNNADITIVELGGTVGEYQVLLFLEAARMMKAVCPEDIFTILVSYLPTPPLLGEQKSKPTQYAIRTLNSAGIMPDFILCRATLPVNDSIKNTISTICSLPKERIISAPDVESIYDIPVNFEKENFGEVVLKSIGLNVRKKNMEDWEELQRKTHKMKERVTIGIVGKYFNLKSCRDTYISVIEAIKHASWYHNVKPDIKWLDAEVYETHPEKLKELQEMHGIIIPGGFGKRGIEGMIAAAGFARAQKIPYFGLCLGMQIAVIDSARNVAGLEKANSEEFDPASPHQVIHLMKSQKEVMAKSNYGGTMRLGSYPCGIEDGTIARRAYGKPLIAERHRHRYEFNNTYRERLARHGLVPSGVSPDGLLVEMIELKKHPFFVGVQFHPEFKSRPLHPHPLFQEFVRSALKQRTRIKVL